MALVGLGAGMPLLIPIHFLCGRRVAIALFTFISHGCYHNVGGVPPNREMAKCDSIIRMASLMQCPTILCTGSPLNRTCDSNDEVPVIIQGNIFNNYAINI